MALRPEQSRVSLGPTGQRIRVVRPASIEPVLIGMQQTRRALSGAATSAMQAGAMEAQGHMEMADAAQEMGQQAFEVAAGVMKQEGARDAASAEIVLDAQGRPKAPDLGSNPMSIYDNAYNEVLEKRYVQSLSTSLQEKAVQLRTRPFMDSQTFAREFGDYLRGTVDVVLPHLKGGVGDAGQRLMQGHLMDLGQKEAAKVETEIFAKEVSTAKALANSASILYGQFNTKAGDEAYEEAKRTLESLRGHPRSNQQLISQTLTKLENDRNYNRFIGWIRYSTEDLGLDTGDRLKFLDHLSTPAGQAEHKDWVGDLDVTELRSALAILKGDISLTMAGDRSAANSLIFSLLLDQSTGKSLMPIEDLLVKTEGLNDGARAQVIARWVTIQNQLKAGSSRLERAVEQMTDDIKVGNQSLKRGDLEREALSLIVQAEKKSRLSDPDNQEERDQIAGLYAWGSKNAIGTLTDIVQRVGLLPLDAKQVLWNGFQAFGNRKAVDAGLNIYKSVVHAGNADHEITEAQRTFYQAYMDGIGTSGDPDATLKDLEYGAKIGEGADPYQLIFGNRGEVPTAETKRDARAAWNTELESKLPSALLAAAAADDNFGAAIRSLRPTGGNPFGSGGGHSGLFFSPAIMKRARDISESAAPGWKGDQEGFMNHVVRMMTTGPDRISLSLTTFMPGSPMQEGANPTQYALENYIPSVGDSGIDLVHDHLRQSLLKEHGHLITSEQVDALELGENIWLSPNNTSGSVPTYNIWYRNSDGNRTLLMHTNDQGAQVEYEFDISPVMNAINSDSRWKDFFSKVHDLSGEAVKGADFAIERAKDYIRMSYPDVAGDKVSSLADQFQARINVSSLDTKEMSKIPITAAGITGDSFRKMINLIPEPARLVWEAFDVNVIRGEIVGSGKKTVFTEKNFHPPVLEVIRQAGRNALKGRELEPGTSISVSYPHYPKTARGLTAETIVGNGMSASYRKIREAIYSKDALGWTRLAYDATTDPVMRTAYSVGGFMLHRAKDGSYFIDDKFNFNGYHNKSKSDGYAWLRHIFSKAEGAPQRTSEGPRVYLKLGDKL